MSFGWDEGRFFDLWMLPHLLTGVIGAFSNVFFALSTPMVYAIGVALMTAWEWVEYLVGIRESWENRLIDVAIGAVGITLALAIGARLGHGGRLVAFWVSLAVGVPSGVAGWAAHRRRARPDRAGSRG